MTREMCLSAHHAQDADRTQLMLSRAGFKPCGHAYTRIFLFSSYSVGSPRPWVSHACIHQPWVRSSDVHSRLGISRCRGPTVCIFRAILWEGLEHPWVWGVLI